MSGSILKYKTCVDDGIASLWTFLYNLMESLTNCSDVLRRNISSYYFADKLISCFVSFWINRLNVTNHSSVLSCTACLLLVQIIKVLFLQNSFSVINTWLASLALNAELPLYSLDVNLQMQFTHSTDNHFLRLLVHAHTESRIFSLEL
jgi:hypothetical protein